MEGEKHIRIRHVYRVEHPEEMSCLPTLTYNPALLTPFYFTCPIEGEKDIRISHVYRVEHPAEMPLFTNNYLDCLPDDITRYIMDLTKPPSIDEVCCKLVKNLKSPMFEGSVPIDDDACDYEYYYTIDTGDSSVEYITSLMKDYLDELDDEQEQEYFEYWFPNDDYIYDCLPERVKRQDKEHTKEMYNLIRKDKEYVIRSILFNRMCDYFKKHYVLTIVSKSDNAEYNEDHEEMVYRYEANFQRV